MSYQVLARKWRPRRFEDMVGQEHILQMLTNALTQQRIHHAYLFTGTRGVGKTTLARILAKCLNCELGITSNPCQHCTHCLAIDEGRFLDLIEVDAASRTRVEDTRELLDNVSYAPTQGRFKVYLIDEVHMLSNHSFNALLKTLEEPPAHVKFLLATTDPKKLPITVLSRCLQFNLKRVPDTKIVNHLRYLCEQEAIQFEDPTLPELAKAADGSVRDALSLLDQAIAFCNSVLTLQAVLQMLGNVERGFILKILRYLGERNGNALFAEINNIADFSPNYQQILEELLACFHELSLHKVVKDYVVSEDLAPLDSLFSPEELQLYYQIALIGRRDLPLNPSPLRGFEMVLLRMLAFTPVSSEESKTVQVPSVEVPSLKHSEFKVTEKVKPFTKATTQWETLLPQLKLTGLAQSLALNSQLLSIEDNNVVLALEAKHEALFTKKLATRIEQALSDFFGKTMDLSIKITKKDLDTVAKQQEAKVQQRKAEATQAIKNDEAVKQMMNVFDATIDEDSITAID